MECGQGPGSQILAPPVLLAWKWCDFHCQQTIRQASPLTLRVRTGKIDTFLQCKSRQPSDCGSPGSRNLSRVATRMIGHWHSDDSRLLANTSAYETGEQSSPAGLSCRLLDARLSRFPAQAPSPRCEDITKLLPAPRRHLGDVGPSHAQQRLPPGRPDRMNPRGCRNRQLSPNAPACILVGVDSRIHHNLIGTGASRNLPAGTRTSESSLRPYSALQ